MCDGNLAMANHLEHNDDNDAFNPTETQIELYKEIRKITNKYHEYSDQMMAIAIWIDSVFKHKNK